MRVVIDLRIGSISYVSKKKDLRIGKILYCLPMSLIVHFSDDT